MQILGGCAHRHRRLCDQSLRAEARVEVDLGGHGMVAHVLDAAGEHDVCCTERDLARTGRHRRQRPGAHPVERESGDALRNAGQQRDVAPERQSLVSNLRGGGEDDVADPLRLELRVAAQQFPHDLDAHVVRACAPEDPVLARAPECRADAVDEDDFPVHEWRVSLGGCARLCDDQVAELRQMPAVRLQDLAVELHEHEAGHRELARVAELQHMAQRSRSVTRRVDGLGRLGVVLGPSRAGGKVRQVRDDEIDRLRHGLEEVALGDVHAIRDPVEFCVRARELDGRAARVSRPDFGVRRCECKRHADHTRAGTDVGDAHRPLVDVGERRIDEGLGRRTRREHAPRCGEELESVEGGFHENAAVTDWAGNARREQERYRDGESRLPDASDPDARQRQLTRMGNAAAGSGLALVMQGSTSEARTWFDLACARYRESWDDAPPGSWGRPIGMIKSRVLAGDWPAAEREARFALERGAADVESAFLSLVGAPQ